jgi:hydroxyacylglutathione hydrolase
MFNITPVPAFQDNYIWVIHNNCHAAVVDPGDAEPVFEFLTHHALQLSAILCTHRHYDHIGGIAELRKIAPVPVYGHSHPGNPHITHPLYEGNSLYLPWFNLTLQIIEVPGHLDDHIAYIGPDLVFCGDVLFGAGCGRNKEGSLEQLHHSLQRLGQLKDTTQVYCAHEYTWANIQFALVCEPHNDALQQRAQHVRQLRAAGLPSLPSTIGLEKATNPFLRCDMPTIIQTLQQRGLEANTELAVFKSLRTWRNTFVTDTL